MNVKTKKIGIYLRVSTEEQARVQDGSLVSQRQRLLDYVEAQNRIREAWGEVSDVYCDEGKSGKDMNRPEFKRLLQDVKHGRVNLILSTELSRLSRSIKDFCELWELFRKHETGFVTLREQFDTTTAAGEMMVFNLINFSQFERKQTAERIAANFESRAKRGLWNGGNIPFGFDKNPKNPAELIPHESEAKQVKEVFELFLEMSSVRQTCLELKRRGITGKSYVNKHGIKRGARQITVTTLQKMLTNVSYIGLRAYGKGGKRNVEIVKAAWKPLIDERLFKQVHERLQANKNKYKPSEWKRYEYPMTELVVCGECGKKLGGQSATSRNGEKHYYYGHARQLHSDGITHAKRCRLERVKVARIENLAIDSLKKLASDEELLTRWLDIYAKQSHAGLPELSNRVKQLEREIRTLSTRNQNLIERLSELPKNVPADAIYAQIKANSEKADELARGLDRVRNEERQATHRAVDRDALLFRVRRAIQMLEKMPTVELQPKNHQRLEKVFSHYAGMTSVGRLLYAVGDHHIRNLIIREWRKVRHYPDSPNLFVVLIGELKTRGTDATACDYLGNKNPLHTVFDCKKSPLSSVEQDSRKTAHGVSGTEAGELSREAA